MREETSLADFNSPPVPQVDDGYWFGYSKNLIDNALKLRDDTADKLQTFVGWLWTLYTTTALIGINFAKLSMDFWSTVLICSPVGTLILVYWLTVWVRMPALMEFDPRSPDEIQSAYEHNLVEKQKRLTWTLAIVGFAAALVVIGLVRSATIMSMPPRVQVDAAFSSDGGKEFVSFQGYVVGGKSGTLSVYSLPRKPGDVPLYSELLPLTDGRFSVRPVNLATTTSALQVEISADLDAETKVTVRRKVSVPPTEPSSDKPSS
jgi:hypothetical protein